jgi:crotonobetainyl-CoA:carnitine CoA-transferase CaiB-like acyl-CoA transferase
VPEPPLAGFTVVDLSTGIAGAYCTKLLADGGADVIKVEPPGGDALRLWSASGAELAPDEDGALFSFLAGSKRSVVAGRADQLLAGADAAVWSRGSERTPGEILAAHPHLIVTAITPFGLEGPWADRHATEFTLQAWAGAIVGSGRGRPDRAPVHVGGQPGEWLAGAFAAAGTMASRGREIVDVSILEALVLCLTFYPVTFHDRMGRRMYPTRFVRTPGVSAAQDGLVGLGCGTGQHWLDFCAMSGHPEWAEDESLFLQRAHLAPEIDAWVAEHRVDEVRELATAFRIPNAPIGNGANLPGFDHFRARGTFVPNPRDGFLQPDLPYRLQPAELRRPEPAPRLGEHTGTAPPVSRTREPLPLDGLRVLDLTAFWAGPSCTHLLALLGAEVIHLESPSRLDGVRMVGAPRTDEQWWERSPIFSALNTSKKSLALDLGTERGRELLHRLIPTCDVLIEAYTPRVLEQLGLSFDLAKELRADIVMVRMPGFGLDGPWRDVSAMAFIIEDAAGLTWMTGYPDANPYEPWTIADPNAGIHALNGLLLALEHRRRTGEAVLVEAAMIDAALNVAAEQVIEHSAYGALLARAGNRGPAAAPQNAYLSADSEDSWVAIAVATDEQWEALCGALDDPQWAADPRLATAAGRRAQHDQIDRQLGAWCRARRAEEVVDVLWDVGVPVGRVIQPNEQADLPQLAARGFFETLEHPVAGRARHSTMPMRFSSRSGPIHTRHAPLLGEHNRELLGDLGLLEEELDALEAEGVIGRKPHE